MSIPTTTPRLIPIVAGTVVAGIAMIGLTQCGSDAPPPEIRDHQIGSSRAEGDTPAEVLARVAMRQTESEAATKETQRQLTSLQNQLERLMQQPPAAAQQAAQQPSSRQVELGQVKDAEIDRLRRQLNETKDELERLRKPVNNNRTRSTAGATGSDIPPDFGYDAVDESRTGGQRATQQQPRRSLSDLSSLITGGPSLTSIGTTIGSTVGVESQWITVRPLDIDSPGAMEAVASAVNAATPPRVLTPEAESRNRNRSNQGRQPDEAVKEVYTIPANATLLGAQAMTAIIGRIPSSGSVSDPYPFKIITGPENLASNGIEIPGLEGMVWQGTAVGDWGLGCVRGSLDQVTFTFQDGTIRTVTYNTAQSESGQRSSNSGNSLGWISDERGICVQGERITNAAPILAARMGVSMVDAAAKAVSRAETTTVLNQITGAGQEYVTGDVLRYAGFAGLGAGADDFKRWLDQRLNQIFDAVYAPPGQPITIHTNIEIAIDYDPIGRKVDHEQIADATHHRPLD